jgi:hypothetical protein
MGENVDGGGHGVAWHINLAFRWSFEKKKYLSGYPASGLRYES